MDFTGVDADQLLWINLMLAAVLVGAGALSVWQECSLTITSRMDGAKWDVGKSWASNLTAVGAAAATILASSGIVFSQDAAVAPEHLTRGEYQALSLFFVVLVLAGPFLYNAIRVGDEKGGEVEFQGFVVLFFASALLTVWATLGQLWLVHLLADELRANKAMTDFAATVFEVGAAVLWILALIYSFLSIRDHVRFYREKPPAPGKKTSLGIAPSGVPTRSEPKRWPIL